MADPKTPTVPRVWESFEELDVLVALAFDAAERRAVGAIEWIEEES